MFDSTLNFLARLLGSNVNSQEQEKQQEMRVKPRIITIEGNIASGKSTCVEHLREYYKYDPRVKVLLEPLHTWQQIKDSEGKDMITKFYGDISKYAFAFQMMAYISRLAILKEALDEPGVEIIITERCLLTDKHVFAKMLYDDGKLEDVEYQIYTMWFDNFLKDLPTHEIFYIRAEPQIALNRLNLRARSGEVVSLDYLENIHTYHENWLKSHTENVFIVDGDVDKNSHNSPADVVLHKVQSMFE